MNRESVMKNHCAFCYGKFGLVRYRRGFKSFCSKACVERHVAWLRADVQKRKGWLDCLYAAGSGGPAIKHRAEAA
jgi:hypothetical protein